MIGKNQLVYSANDFLKGVATSNYSSDGGLGLSSATLNPFLTPGIIRATAPNATPSGTVTGVMIASCDDTTNLNGTGTRMFLDDAAHFYLYNGSFTSKQTGAKTYTQGITDFTAFNGKFWATSGGDLTMWDGTATAGATHFDETYWTTTKSKSALVSGSSNPHPLLVFEKLLWIGDTNNLHNLDESATATTNVLSIASNESIIALGIDPSSGLMLISAIGVTDYTTASSMQAFVYLFDGYSTKPRRKIAVNAPVTAFYSVGGQVFVAYGQNIGIWNGSGISFLRRLKNVTLSNTSLISPHRVTSIGSKFFIADGSTILCYGQAQPGVNAWFPIAASASAATSILCYVGNNKLGIGGSSGVFRTVDISSTSAGSGTLSFPYHIFPWPAYIRRVRVVTDGITTTAGIGGIALIDDTQTSRTPTISTFVVAAAASPLYVFDFDYSSLKLNVMQPVITLDTQAFDILSVIIYYDVAE